VKTLGHPAPETAVRREIWAVDRNIAITETGSLQSLLALFTYTEPRFDLVTSGAFAGIGLLLVVIGVFSVMAYTVSLRTHEIGIRRALGAAQGSILKMVLTKGLRLIAAGVVIGLLVSLPHSLHRQPDLGHLRDGPDYVCAGGRGRRFRGLHGLPAPRAPGHKSRSDYRSTLRITLSTFHQLRVRTKLIKLREVSTTRSPTYNLPRRTRCSACWLLSRQPGHVALAVSTCTVSAFLSGTTRFQTACIAGGCDGTLCLGA
jgi:hypothetical protein